MSISKEIAAAFRQSDNILGEATFALFSKRPLLMGIGSTPFDRVSAKSFSGKLPIMVNFQAAAVAGAHFYQILVDDVPATDSWTNYKWNGRANALQTVNVKWVGPSTGCYPVHPLDELFLWQSPALGCVLDSRAIADGEHTLQVQFLDSAGAPLAGLKSGRIQVGVNNRSAAGKHVAARKGLSIRCDSLCCPYEPAYS